MYAASSVLELILGSSGKYPSRAIETPRSGVSRRCAATSLTFHLGETVCFSQSSGVRERSNSSNMASSFGKRWAVRIGLTGLSLHSRLVLSPDAMDMQWTLGRTTQKNLHPRAGGSAGKTRKRGGVALF